jgi:hypothetical protein
MKISNGVKSNLKILLQSSAVLVFLNCLIFALLPLSLQAQTIPATPQTTQQRCQNFKNLFGLSNSTNISNGVPIYCSATTVILGEIQAAFAIAGTVAVLFLIFGGFTYLASAGNEEQAEKGKKIIINSIIGLVVIIMSTVIVTIVAGLLSGGS